MLKHLMDKARIDEDDILASATDGSNQVCRPRKQRRHFDYSKTTVTHMTMRIGYVSVRWFFLLFSGFVQVACAHGNYAADEAITHAAVRALIHEEQVNLTRVDVQTKDGTVYLSGEVQNYEQKKKAEQIARTVPGLRRVVNKLELQP